MLREKFRWLIARRTNVRVRCGESVAASTCNAFVPEKPLMPTAEAREIARVLERWRASLPSK